MSTLLANFNLNNPSPPAGWVSLSGTGVGGTANQNGVTLTVEVAFSGQTSSSTVVDQDHYGVPEAVLEGYGVVNVGAGTQLRISGLTSGQSGFIRFGGGSTSSGRHRLLTVDSVTYQHDNPGGAAPVTPEPPVDALFVADANGEVVFTLDAVTINAVFPYFQVFADTGLSITAADDIADETQPATVTLSGNTAAPTAITINGTAATGITDQGAGVYSYTPPLIADDATATLAVTVDGETLTTTISYANSYPYELVTHGTPNSNSIFFGTQFATNGPVEWGVVADYDPAIVIVNHAAMDVAEDELNDVALHSTEVSAGTTTATYKYFVPKSGATGTWQSEITVTDGVTPPVEPPSDNWPFGKGIVPSAPVNWSWGKRHPKTGMRTRIHK